MGNGTEGTEEAPRKMAGLSSEELQKRFFYRVAKDMANNQKHAIVGEHYFAIAKSMAELLPAGRALSCALTALEESALWAHQAIDSHETYK